MPHLPSVTAHTGPVECVSLWITHFLPTALSLTDSFLDQTSRTWASLGPETWSAISVGRLWAFRSDQIRSDQSLSRVRLFATPWIAARQASLSIANSRSSLRLTSIESVMPSSHLILCHPLLLLPPIPPWLGSNTRHMVSSPKQDFGWVWVLTTWAQDPIWSK